MVEEEASQPSADDKPGGRPRPVRQLPEPARFWIVFSPRRWHSAEAAWTDLANARISDLRNALGETLPDLDTSDLDDLLYLPPVAADLAAKRDAVARQALAVGAPVLIELLPGETTTAEGATVVYDLLGALLAGDVGRLRSLPAGAAAVWPLIGGLSDREELWEEGCAALAAAGVSYVQAQVVDLAPALRRQLAESCGEEVFDALFHGERPSERKFASLAHRFGLRPFLHRPPSGTKPRYRRNRRLAAALSMAGELWLRLGRSANIGNALFRAARGAERTSHDLAALAREDNLDVMDWLESTSVAVVEDVVAHGRSALVDELLEEYLTAT
jgi:hypothetical protein